MVYSAPTIDANFLDQVEKGVFPKSHSNTTPVDAGLDSSMLLQLFDSQLKSRHLDLIARYLKQQNHSFYTIGSSGHEGNAAIALAFRHDDMAFLHYRSGAFFIERARKVAHQTPVEDLLRSLVASKSDPIANGRHKVFGSKPLFIPPQTSTIGSHCPKAVGAALSISRATELGVDALLASDSVVLCSIGDASLNHASVQTALNTAQSLAYSHYPLPLVFICEDNGIGISVPTPRDWVETVIKSRTGIHYLSCDGLNVLDVFQKAKQAEHLARDLKQPVFLHMKCVRLLGHAGSDIETVYRSQEEIAKTQSDDPLLHTARLLIENNSLASNDIIALYTTVKNTITTLSETIIKEPKLTSAQAVMESLIPPMSGHKLPPLPDEKQRKAKFAQRYDTLEKPRNLSQSINLALTDLMTQYANIIVFGEDVAGKGGVYNVTHDLVNSFGQRRVFDSILDETMILGTAIGFAHNGLLPIPEIQFLAYFHNAEDQLRGEAATLPFFSNGQYTNPMVIRIPSLAYQKGFGGHFHNDNSIAAIRDIPGVIIACPSNGADAVKMLREAVRLAYVEQRIVIFLEPIALYMTKDLHQLGDNAWLSHYPALSESIPVGEVNCIGEGNELTILSYANGFYLSLQAAKILEEGYQTKIKVIDMRWLSPLPKAALLSATKDCQHILIVDECRETGSISEALIALFHENSPQQQSIKRLCAKDSFIPLGDAWQYVLPSVDDIVQASRALLALNE